MTNRALSASASLSLLCALALSGCGVGLNDTTGSTINAAFKGHIMGGQQPVAHASVRFYAASKAGYGHAATAISPAVPSDQNGAFSLSTAVDCTTVGAKAQTFVVATGGNPGLDESKGTINNSAIALVALLGDCDSLNSSTYIEINEVTTVAAAWALAPFALDFNLIGTSSGNTVGLANAFGMAANLANYVRGTSPGDAPSGAVVPNDEVNYMANILASCVNTKGYTVGDKSPCDNLFTDATPPVPSTAPTNIFAAALSIAQHPGNNVALIAALPTPQAPFPSTGAAPTDWTMAITFPIGPTKATNFAIDAKGDVWSVATDGLYELSPTGVQQPSYSTLPGNNVAFDPSGNIWVAISGATPQIAKMPANLSAPTFYDVSANTDANISALAIDGTGDIWYTCLDCMKVTKMTPDGSNSVQSSSNGGGNSATNISIDPSENVWVGTYAFSGFYVYTSTDADYPNGPSFGCGNECGNSAFIANDHAGHGWIVGRDLTLVAGPGLTYTSIESPSGGLFNPVAVAIDGSGNAWVADHNSTTPSSGAISEFDNAGNPVSPDTGYTSPSLDTPGGIAVDGSGNVWIQNTGHATVTAFVGAATPVVTPFSVGLATGKLGQEP